MKSLRWILLAVLSLAAFALIAAGVKLSGSPEHVAAQAGLYIALDMDITDGGPCVDIDDSVVHAVGDPNYGVGICLSGMSAALGSFEVSVRYDDTLNQASDVTCAVNDSRCLDSNPDVNAGSTTWGTSLGSGWDCSGFGFWPPRGDRDPSIGAGNGEAYIGCWSSTGPWTMGDDETSGTLGVVTFHVIAGGSVDNLTLSDVVIGDSQFNDLGSCNPPNPDMPEMTCVGGSDAKEGTPPPTNTPTITPTATCTPCPGGICPTSTPTPGAWTPTPTPTLDANSTPAPGHEAITISSLLCLTGTVNKDWNNDTVVDGADSAVALSACNVGLMDEGMMEDLIRILDGDHDDPQPEDFASIDKEMGQMHEVDGKLWFIAFVTNDEPIGFHANEGSFPISGSATLLCGPMAMPGYDFEEEDCDDDGDRGDGIVAVMLFSDDADRGQATARVRQGQSEISLDYTIVGEPYEIQVDAAEQSIELGAADCDYPQTEAEWSSTLADPKKTVLTAQVFDSDGTPVTGALVTWQSEDAGKADAATTLGVTTDEGISGIRIRNALCGATTAGGVTITATIAKAIPGGGPTLDPGAQEDTDTVEVLVISSADDVDGDGVLNGEDNCPTGYNPDQENSDALPIDNGPSIAETDYTVPNDDNLGDVCDIDDDNDQWPDMFEAMGCDSGPTNARGDVSYDDNQDGNVAPPMGTDSADNGPSWDTDADEVIDGLECALGSDPRNPAGKPPAVPPGDADRDGLPANIEEAVGCSDSAPDSDGDTIPDGVEVKGWGTSCASKDTDADWCEDWIEMVDVNGDKQANILDALWFTKAAFGMVPPNPALDMDRNGAVNLLDAFIATLNSNLVRAHDPCP